ncbi:hypothetical protein LBMAG53_13330 [Planctomycetota bacterium]|nr:hypothetical protein LBMAG53_13330 [Planctomycetota bacterium]
MSTPRLFSVEGLSKRFGSRTVVNRVDLHVDAGELIGLLGANGAGKSTTFRMIVGLYGADAGRIQLEQRDITHLPMHARARLGLGYLAQEPTIFAALSVADNVRIVLEQHYPRREHAGRLDRLLDELGLGHLRDNRAGRLSGGERRRLEIARALAVEPKLLFFDEPLAAIDPKSRADIAETIRSLRRRGVSVLITDHNAHEVLRLVDRLYVMHAGEVIAAGTPAQVIADPVARDRYLGNDFSL